MLTSDPPQDCATERLKQLQGCSIYINDLPKIAQLTADSGGHKALQQTFCIVEQLFLIGHSSVEARPNRTCALSTQTVQIVPKCRLFTKRYGRRLNSTEERGHKSAIKLCGRCHQRQNLLPLRNIKEGDLVFG